MNTNRQMLAGMSKPPPSRPDLNTVDPLLESTVNRRMTAAYRKAGYNRKQFAEALGLTYQALDSLDTGKSTPKLSTLVRTSELTEYTLDELVYGYHSPGTSRTEKLLSRDQVTALLLEIRATLIQIEALHEFLKPDSPGSLQPLTRSFVIAFVERYALEIEDGTGPAKAQHAAKVSAVNARENAAAASARRSNGSVATTAALPASVIVPGVAAKLAEGIAAAVKARKKPRKRRTTHHPRT